MKNSRSNRNVEILAEKKKNLRQLPIKNNNKKKKKEPGRFLLSKVP